MKRRRSIQLSAISLILFASACTNTTEGQVRIQVVRGQITRIIRPTDGWVNTFNTVGDEYYDVDLKSFTNHITVDGSTKDNAGVKVEVGITAHLINDNDSIQAHVRKFGLEAEERKKRLEAVLGGQVNTEVKNAVAKHEAYGLLASQSEVQNDITKSVRQILKDQMQLELESVQIIGRPDFVDDRIEKAASAVVANQKLKEAAEAELAAAKIEAEKNQIKAQTFSNPALLKLEELRLKLEIERARAEGIKGHNGPLTIVNGADPQIQLRGAQ